MECFMKGRMVVGIFMEYLKKPVLYPFQVERTVSRSGWQQEKLYM